MRRSICFTQPTHTQAGKTGTWKFVYTPSQTLPQGARLKFDLLSKGRPIDWEIPETDLSKKTSVIWLDLQNSSPLPFTRTEDDQFAQFETTLPREVKAGESFTISIGQLNPEKHALSRAQKIVQRRKSFHLYIDPKGKGEYKDRELFQMDIRGGHLQSLRVIAPSIVTRNKRFDVIVRFEDEFGNLTANAPEGTLIDLSYRHLRENLNWKLFVPETGFLTLPNLYFNEPGVYKLRLKNLLTNQVFFSPPIKCYQDYPLNLFWGVFHGESERFDATEHIESCLRYFRDEKAYHFYGVSAFDAEQETSSDIWKLISNQVTEFNEEDRFSTFLGFQWTGEATQEGIRQFLYTKDSKPLLRKKDTKTNSLKKIYKTHQAKDLLAIPSFTMNGKKPYDFTNFDPQFERVVEIYNAWGSSECMEKEGNPRPIKSHNNKGIGETSEGSVRKALERNCRFGFVAGGFDDRGIYEGLFDTGQQQYSSGLTAVLSKDHSRSSLFDALQKRRCYATTGARMILGFYIGGEQMGSELSNSQKPGLALNRHISGYVIGTSELEKVEIVRNSQVLHTFSPEGDTFDFAYDDTQNLQESSIGGDPFPFVYYYLRTFQKDGHIGWSSPIWVDYHATPQKISAPKKVVKKS